MTFFYKCVEVHTSASRYGIAILLLFSFSKRMKCVYENEKN